MTELEKAIKGLECCVRDVRCKAIRTCDDCPYDNDGLEKPCQTRLMTDALALLKEQEARVMTPYEVRSEYEIVWLDRKNISCEVAILQRIACSMYEFSIMGTDEMPSLLESQYGKTWRCWTSRPSEEMRDTKWEEKSDAE